MGNKDALGVDATGAPQLVPNEYEVLLPKNPTGCTFHFGQNSSGRPFFRKHDGVSHPKLLLPRKGDEFVAVDGVPLTDLSYEEARRLLKRCFRTKGFVQLRLRDCRHQNNKRNKISRQDEYVTRKLGILSSPQSNGLGDKGDSSSFRYNTNHSSTESGSSRSSITSNTTNPNNEQLLHSQRLSKLEEQLIQIETELQKDRERYLQPQPLRSQSIFVGNFVDDNEVDANKEEEEDTHLFSASSPFSSPSLPMTTTSSVPSSVVSDMSHMMRSVTVLSDCPTMTEDTTTALAEDQEEQNDDGREDSTSPMLERALALTKSFTSLMSQEKNLMDTMTEMNHMMDSHTSDWVSTTTPERSGDEEAYPLMSSSSGEEGDRKFGLPPTWPNESPRRRQRRRQPQEQQDHSSSESQEKQDESEVTTLRRSVVRLEKQVARQKQELAQHRRALVDVAQTLETERQRQQEGANKDNDEETEAVLRNLLLLAAVGGCLFQQSVGNRAVVG